MIVLLQPDGPSQVLQRGFIMFVAAPLALMAFIMVSAFCFLPFVMTWWINKGEKNSLQNNGLNAWQFIRQLASLVGERVSKVC